MIGCIKILTTNPAFRGGVVFFEPFLAILDEMIVRNDKKKLFAKTLAYMKNFGMYFGTPLFC